MHQAPAVTYPFGPTSWPRWGLFLIGSVTLAAFAAWWFFSASPWWIQALAWVLAAGVSMNAWRWQAGMPVGELCWTGDGWCWRLASQPQDWSAGRVVSCLDWQQGMLLKLLPQDRHQPERWVLVGALHWPARWLPLRRAVYSRAAQMAH